MTQSNTKISLCITTYNRTNLVVRAFSQVLNHPNIDEVVIVDDCSTEENYQALRSLLIGLKSPKVKLFRNKVNLDCYQNKKRAVELASNEWVILFDSDNILGMDYVDKLVAQEEWALDCIYAPDFAKPHFSYAELSNENIYASNVSSLMGRKNFDCMINTANYFVNRKWFLKIHKSDIDPHAADTAYFNYCWLNSGCTIKVVQGLQYQHDVHDGSHYKEHNHKSNGLFDELIGKFKTMSINEFKNNAYHVLPSEIHSQYAALKRDTSIIAVQGKSGSGKSFTSDEQDYTEIINHVFPETSIVTAKPQGRMGNALFQYGAAFAYAKKHGLRFSIPTQTNDPKWNPIYLDHLLIPHGMPDVSIKEKIHFKYDELEFHEEWRYGKVVELDGYFQNPKYFQEYRKEILEAFGFKWEAKEDTISIHERRGDFLIYTDKHPAFSDEYMCEAMDMFRGLGFKKFLVFSDDIPWCRGYFNDIKFNWAQIDFQEGKSEMEDIAGIASCAGHINSPSTFSWWGAWLGSRTAVTATPKVWLLHAHSNEFTEEIIPSDWMRI